MKIRLKNRALVPGHLRSAFTILEIMVAMALLSLIVVAIYSSWNSILKGSKVALDAAAAAQRTRMTVRTVHDAFLCACMFKSTGASNYYDFIASGDSEDSAVSFVARLPKSFPRGGKFGDFTLRRVEFTVEPDGDRGKRLVMRQRPIIMDFDKDEMLYPLVLAKNLKKFTIEYSDPTDPKLADWSTDWEQTNKMPREVRITIGLGSLDQFSSAPQEMVVDVVALESVSVPAAYQTPVGNQQNQGIGQPGNNNANGANQPGRPGLGRAPGAGTTAQ